jgi:hypothetical protein
MCITRPVDERVNCESVWVRQRMVAGCRSCSPGPAPPTPTQGRKAPPSMTAPVCLGNPPATDQSRHHCRLSGLRAAGYAALAHSVPCSLSFWHGSRPTPTQRPSQLHSHSREKKVEMRKRAVHKAPRHGGCIRTFPSARPSEANLAMPPGVSSRIPRGSVEWLTSLNSGGLP